MNIIAQGIVRLKRFGWTRNTYGDEQIGYCMLGCVPMDNNWHIALEVIEKVLVEQYPNIENDRKAALSYAGSLVPYFNDYVATSADDVIPMLEKAAVKWDEMYG